MFLKKSSHMSNLGQGLPNGKKIIAIDFDGVLHSYVSGWYGADIIIDPPSKGAIKWLEELVDNDDLEVVIFSTRNFIEGGIQAMKQWLVDWEFPKEKLSRLDFPIHKPANFLLIDDRAWCFNGTFPDVKTIKEFKAWHEKL